MQCQSDSKKVWICKQLYTFYRALQKRDGEKTNISAFIIVRVHLNVSVH